MVQVSYSLLLCHEILSTNCAESQAQVMRSQFLLCYTSYEHGTRTLAGSPTATFDGNLPKGITSTRPAPQQKTGSPSIFNARLLHRPRIRTRGGPCFKLADQSPKPLGHRNWPIIFFLLDLLTASSENIQFRLLILYLW